MTNFEKYKDATLTFMKNYDNLPAVVNGKPHYCALNVCNKCDLKNKYKESACFRSFVKWLYEEYVEIPKLVKQESLLCAALRRGFICRDYDGLLCYFTAKPYKNHDHSNWDIKDEDGDYTRLDVLGFQSNFSFIKWEDEEPWSIEELLKLEVME